MAARTQDRGVSSRKGNMINDEPEHKHEETGDDETAENNKDVPPVVLQCKKCNSIVGDSMAWVCANVNDKLKTVTLHSITNAVTPGKKLMTSTAEGIELGSTYIHLVCKQCNEVIGKIFKTTSRQLDSLRDLYTFSISHITSYQVGSQEQTVDVELQAQSLQDSIIKVKAMICALNDRILNFEKALGLSMLKKDAAVQVDNTALKRICETIDATNDQTKTKNLPASQQDKTVAVHSDNNVAKREASEMTESVGRRAAVKRAAVKRTKEATSLTGSNRNKRSRIK